MTYEKKLAMAKNLAKKMKLGLKTHSDKTNGFAGFDNGGRDVHISKEGRIYIVCTCGNCGDGSWLRADVLAKAMMPKKKKKTKSAVIGNYDER